MALMTPSSSDISSDRGGKLLIADGVAAADDILQQIRFGKVAVELCLHIGNGGFRRVGGLELLLLLGGVVEKGKGSGQQQKAEQKDKDSPAAVWPSVCVLVSYIVHSYVKF